MLLPKKTEKFCTWSLVYSRWRWSSFWSTSWWFCIRAFPLGAVFLINIPIILVVLVMIVMIIPKQQEKTDQPINLGQALVLVVAILSLIYSIKSAMYNFSVLTVVMFVVGISTLIHFIRSQKELRHQ